MANANIVSEVLADGVGLIRLNRPQALNALCSPLMQELLTALTTFDSNPQIGAIVITGNEKAFAAGADIKEMAEATSVSMLENYMIEAFYQLRNIKKPLIAAVSGWCLGGGNELAMSCDMIVASETAQFGQPEVNIGVIPGAGGTQRLTNAVGKALAMEIILGGRFLKAEEALRYGLVNRVVPVADYLQSATQLARDIASKAPLAVRMAKEAINKTYEMSLAEGMNHERHLFYSLFATDDQKEGMQAFVEKRKPQWQGK